MERKEREMTEHEHEYKPAKHLTGTTMDAYVCKVKYCYATILKPKPGFKVNERRGEGAK